MGGGRKNRDFRQIDFIYFFLNPQSETYADAYNSAKKAGYSETYCKNITQQMPEWIANALGKRRVLLQKAEKKLEEAVEHEDMKIAQDTAKFIAKTLGKEHYSERVEKTGAGGRDLAPTVIVFGENDPLNSQLKGRYESTPQLGSGSTPAPRDIESGEVQGSRMAPESAQDDAGR